MAVSLDVEKLLVSKIIGEQSFAEAGDIQAHFFSPGVYRSAFEYIIDYHAAHGQIPSLRVMQNDCPDARLVEVDVPWSDLVQRMQFKHIKGIMDSRINDVAEALDSDDIPTAVNLWGSITSKIHNDVPMSRDVNLSTTGDQRLAAYRERKDNPNTMVGIPTGFPTLDKATQGLQRGQLITLTGLPKSSKSVFALLIAKAAQEYGKKVLYVTFEMTCEEIAQRLDAYRAGINDMKLLSGNFNDGEWQKVTQAVHQTENLPDMVISEDCMTVTAIGAKIDLLKPDIVIVDGVYMMEDEEGHDKGSPQALTRIVAGLKFMAMNRDICVVDVTQSTPARTKGEALNNDSMMGSRSFAQYSNVVVGVERTEDVKVRKFKILMTRRGAPAETLVLMDFDNGVFTEIEGVELDDDFDRELMGDDDETEFAGNY